MTKQPNQDSLPERWYKEKHRLNPEIVKAVELATKIRDATKEESIYQQERILNTGVDT